MSENDFDPDAAAPEDSGVFGLPYTPENASVVLLPVPFEATTSYGGGTSKGPAAIFEASKQVDLFDAELGAFHETGIAMLEPSKTIQRWNREAKQAAKPIIRAGGANTKALRTKLALVNKLSEKVNHWVETNAGSWMDQQKLVGVIGGDHSVPFGAIKAAASRWPGMGILHFDAHADLRKAYEGFTFSHASIHYNTTSMIPEVGKLVQVGIRDVGKREVEYMLESKGRIITNFAHESFSQWHQGQSWESLCKKYVDALPEKVWLSFDIDGFEPHLCPHTGTPVPGGWDFAQLMTLLRVLVSGGHEVIGFDLCEVAPGPKGDEWDGNVGARLLYKMIGFALRSRRKLT